MVEYIEVFEKRSDDLTLTDLISYTGYDLQNTGLRAHTALDER